MLPSGWIQGVRWLPSPNFNSRSQSVTINLLVIHNISLPPGEFGGDAVDALFCNSLDCGAHPYFEGLRDLHVSAHFFIRRTGQVTQYVSLEERAWHAGASKWDGCNNCNDFSIGIELEGTDVSPYTDEQYAALTGLSRLLMLRYPAITLQRIVGHSDIAPDRKTDPGPAFDWVRFRTALCENAAE